MTWKTNYEHLCQAAPEHTNRPLIGITGNYDAGKLTLADGYYQSVLRAGGTPVVLPPFEPGNSPEILADMLRPLDGIIFSGGGDINPLLLNQQPLPQLHSVCPERDEQELMLARLAADRQIPMLGICKGIQVITAALGGELYQDIWTEATPTIKHSQDLPREYASHLVSIAPDSTLFQIYQQEELPVNSFHHQAVKTPAPGMRVSARSADGIIEAVESDELKSIVGVQWHPECMKKQATTNTQGDVFDWLVDEARSFRAAKHVHEHTITLDSHCDTPMFFPQGQYEPTGDDARPVDFFSRDPRLCVDLHKMQEGGLDASIMVAYLKQEARDEASLLAATEKADRILTQIEEMVARHPQLVDIARTPLDLHRLKHEGRKAIMLGIENGYAIGRDISNVERFRKRGVVYMTLCHNGDNDLCDSARGNQEHGGVSAFGAEVIREMNRVGMMVDLSHGGERSFYDAIDISTQPIVCSHSSARALCDHPRNLTDDQMRALARSGGVAQVTLYHGFLRQQTTDNGQQTMSNGQQTTGNGQQTAASVPRGFPARITTATLIDAMEHLDHMIRVMGIDHVGIGTDFDGDGGVPGCANASELINFTRQLLRRRYSMDDIARIWGGNFLRVMQQVQEAAKC